MELWSVVELLYTLHEPGELSCVCWVDDSLDLPEGSTEVQRGQWCELGQFSVSDSAKAACSAASSSML